MKKYDISIIGGGPIGGTTAYNVTCQGYTVAIFEEHKTIGKPVSCAGLISTRVFDLIDISKKDVIQNTIKGANIHSPSNHILSIGGDRKHAYVIDRIKFDQSIISKAENNGAELYLDTKITSFNKHKKHVMIKTSEEIKSKLLIGADGPFSKTRRITNLPPPVEMLRGISAEIKDTNLKPDTVEIFLGNKIAPGFFAWIIPTNKDGTQARIGLCTSKKTNQPPIKYFEKLLQNKTLKNKLGNIKITSKHGGVIPLGPIKKSYESNTMLVGDAAAQVKPTSGGGIYPGIICAKHCANTAIEALNENDFSSQMLKNYHKRWTIEIGKELNRGMKARNILNKINDKQLDNYILKLQNPKIIDTINKYGDIDHPSKLVKPLIKKLPSLIKILPKLI